MIKVKTKRKIDRNDLIFIVTLLILPTLQFCIFYIGTNLNSFALAFQRYENGKYVPNGWENFRKVFSDLASSQEVRYALKNSFIVYFVGLLISVPIAIIFAFYIYKKFPFFRTFKVLLYLPQLLSMLTLCLLYRYFADNAIPDAMNKFFGINIVSGFYSNRATQYASYMLAFVLFSAGGTLLLYLGAMSGISQSITEASEIDGAGNLTQLVYIFVPLIFPTIKTFFICGMASLFSNQFNLFYFEGLGANPKYGTIGYYFYKLIAERGGRQNYAYVATFGLFLSAMLIPVTLIINKLMDKWQEKIS